MTWLGLDGIAPVRIPPPMDGGLGEVRYHLHVYAERPELFFPDNSMQGSTWQRFDSDTADLGEWAAKTKYAELVARSGIGSLRRGLGSGGVPRATVVE